MHKGFSLPMSYCNFGNVLKGSLHIVLQGQVGPRGPQGLPGSPVSSH